MTKQKLSEFITKEWILIIAALSLLISSVFFRQFPDYSVSDVEVLFILYVLFIAVKGLENSGLILKLSQSIERGKYIPLKLTLTTFFLSMIITNDASLIVIVPLTLLLKVERKDILVILEALAANAGSALTPIGNPQNFFIYWYYNIPALKFIWAITAFPVILLLLLIIISLNIKITGNNLYGGPEKKVKRTAYIYGLLFLLLLLIVIHLLPVSTGILILLYALLFDRNSLRVDYALLVSFFCFFGFAENMKIVLSDFIENTKHIFMYSALFSQVMSNVPVTILFGKITANWKALLWGSNVGGFGSPVGSLANLIAIKLYLSHKSSSRHKFFLVKFLVFGYVSFITGALIYYILIKVY